jgi:hypothetical protein
VVELAGCARAMLAADARLDAAGAAARAGTEAVGAAALR